MNDDKEEWPLAGPFLVTQLSNCVMTILDHHHPVGVAMPPAVVPTMVAMLAEFGRAP